MPDSELGDIDRLLRKADRLHKDGRFEEATEMHLSMLEADSDNVSLLRKASHDIFWSSNWGPLEGKTEKNIKRMFELLKRAVLLDPNNPEIRFELANTMAHYGDGDTDYALEAVKEIRQILERDPTHIPSLFLLSRAYHLLQNSITLEEVVWLHQNAIHAAPDNPRIWESFGEFLDYAAALAWWARDAETIAKYQPHIRQMLKVYENVKAKSLGKDYSRRKEYVDGQIRKCQQALAKLERAENRLLTIVARSKANPRVDERPLLDILEFSILEWQCDDLEPLYLMYFHVKRDTGSESDSIVQAMAKLVKMGLSQAYRGRKPIKIITSARIKCELSAHTDRFLRIRYYESDLYFKITQKGREELNKKIYVSYGKLLRLTRSHTY